MNITVLGTGSVGATLGRRWAANGHAITFGSREPGQPHVRDALAKAGDGARALPIAESIADDTDVVVIATPWEATLDIVSSLRGKLLDRVVIDCTTPLNDDLSGLSIGHDTSAAEQIAAAAPGAKVVKAFGTTGVGSMADPRFGPVNEDLFICGDDADARKRVAALGTELGFDIVDCGRLHAARYLEPLGMLWIHLAICERQGRGLGFKVLRRAE